MKSAKKSSNNKQTGAGLGVLFALDNNVPTTHKQPAQRHNNKSANRTQLTRPSSAAVLGQSTSPSPPNVASEKGTPPKMLIIVKHRQKDKKYDYGVDDDSGVDASAESGAESMTSRVGSTVSSLKSSTRGAREDEEDDDEDNSSISSSSDSSDSVPLGKRTPSKTKTHIPSSPEESQDDEKEDCEGEKVDESSVESSGCTSDGQCSDASSVELPKISALRKKLEQRRMKQLFDDLSSDDADSETEIQSVEDDDSYSLHDESESSQSDDESYEEDELAMRILEAKAAKAGQKIKTTPPSKESNSTTAKSTRQLKTMPKEKKCANPRRKAQPRNVGTGSRTSKATSTNDQNTASTTTSIRRASNGGKGMVSQRQKKVVQRRVESQRNVATSKKQAGRTSSDRSCDKSTESLAKQLIVPVTDTEQLHDALETLQLSDVEVSSPGCGARGDGVSEGYGATVLSAMDSADSVEEADMDSVQGSEASHDNNVEHPFDDDEVVAIVCSDDDSLNDEDCVEAEIVIDDHLMESSARLSTESKDETGAGNVELELIAQESLGKPEIVQSPTQGNLHGLQDSLVPTVLHSEVCFAGNTSLHTGLPSTNGHIAVGVNDNQSNSDLNIPLDDAGQSKLNEARLDSNMDVHHGTAKHRREVIVKRGQWTLGPKIGSGAFGVVYVGMNSATGTLMAVKQITMARAFMNDIRREIDLLKTLKHPNIVCYYGAEAKNATLNIFQEWVAGGSVARLLSKFGPFSFQVIRSYLSQLLDGLCYLHDNGVMHRDIKGSNILVSSEGVVKLCDFGGSKRLESDIMQKHTMKGTPYFCAPEVFEEHYHLKGDVWSVGCVVFQMATGVPPWKDRGISNPVALYNYIKSHPGPPSLELHDIKDFESEGALKSLLELCFRRAPEERPSARELMEAPFLIETHYFSDDDKSSYDRGLFSPSSTGSWDHLPTPSKPWPSPSPGMHRRRKSIGTPINPFLSPPLPKSPSPQLNTKEWPSWARNHKDAEVPLANDVGMDSLEFSISPGALTEPTDNVTPASSTLAGLQFVSG